MTSAISLVQARTTDLDTIIEILEDAGRWLESMGITVGWRPGTFSRQDFNKRILQNEIYLAKMDDEPVGTITVQSSDEDFWGKTPSDALYIHKFAVRRSLAGKGIGSHMLQWTESFAKSLGKRFLRLDCPANDPGIRAYYENTGFKHIRDINRPGWKAALYEKELFKP